MGLSARLKNALTFALGVEGNLSMAEIAAILDNLSLSADGSAIVLTKFLQETATNGITAFATGGQANATLLVSTLNRITVCATGGDSIKLPVSAPGLQLSVINDGVASCNVFGQTGDTINGLAANAAFAVPAGATVVFNCTLAGAWQTDPAQLAQATKFTLDATAGPLVAPVGDLTGANNVFAQYSGIAGSTLTTRTAAQMIADAGLKVGQSYTLRVINSNGATLTLTAGANVTITGHAAILTNTWVDYVVTVNTATTMVFQSVGAGTQP